MRPLISTIFDQLVTRHRDAKRIDLDDIAEVIGPHAVSYDEVEYLVDRLEAEGFSVGEGIGSSDVDIMQQVLTHARALRKTTPAKSHRGGARDGIWQACLRGSPCA